MPVEFTLTNGQIISFGLIPALDNLDQKTVIFRFSLDIWPVADVLLRLIDKSGGSSNGWSIDLVWGVGQGIIKRINYVHRFSGADGVWYSNDNAIAAATGYHVAITYDRTNTANNPLIYLLGSPITVNETSAPAGSANDDSAESFAIGNLDGGGALFPHDGRLGDIRVYNKIFASAEVSEDANTDLFVVPSHGLVFHLPLLGSDGKKAFTGVLSNTNFVYDYMGGNKGTPAGSPIAHPETEMAFP